MATVYHCGSPRRRIAVRDSPLLSGGTWLNGIDYLEVFEPTSDQEAHLPRHRVLLIHTLKDLPDGEIDADWITITGGVRVQEVEPLVAVRAFDMPAAVSGLSPMAADIIAAMVPAPGPDELDAGDNRLDARKRLVVVLCSVAGDFSPYTLTLAPPAGATSTQTWDPRQRTVEFLFRVDCPNAFDCAEPPCVPEEIPGAPVLDYLSRDYASYRRLMLDRMSQIIPEWTERSPADLGVTLVEILAYAADRLSYYQDAVSTEAYLGTARRRVSLRRHARLLDYEISEGINARTWVSLQIKQDLIGSDADPILPAGSPVLSRVVSGKPVLTEEQFASLVELKRPTVFETVHDLVSIHAKQCEMHFYTWEDEDCCLPKGATEATLWGSREDLGLTVGDVIVLLEARSPETGAAADADPLMRHAVRLVEVSETQVDPLTGYELVEVRWDRDDALPFALCLHRLFDPDAPANKDDWPDHWPADKHFPPVSVAWGNIVLADHGRTITGEHLEPPVVPVTGRYRPRLKRSDVTFAALYDHSVSVNQPATAAMQTSVRKALPCVGLSTDGLLWRPWRDLLASGPSNRDFVVEVARSGRANLRFGDDINGQRPAPGTSFELDYRVGNGVSGNIGAGGLAHVVSKDIAGKLLATTAAQVTNPLPAVGGQDPETHEQLRRDAPQAFRIQERAVTAEDYAEVLGRHPRVQQAVATFRWTGSWTTVFVAIDPLGEDTLSEKLRVELLRWLDRYRMAGRDLRIQGPHYVPLRIEMGICVAAGHLRSAVRQRLLGWFTSGLRSDGSQGYFHPDRLSFGQPVFTSALIAEAMKVPGVHSVVSLVVERFDGELSAKEGVLKMAPLEIPRLDNDPNRQENGLLRFEMEGGL